jgi:uncharacterized protein
MTLIAGVLSGCLVGFLLGLIGGGGSVLATPLLLYVVGVQPHVAIGTSAFAVSVNAYVGFLNHARARTVRWRAAVVFALTGIIGAVIGSSIGKAFDGRRLIFFFGVAMIAVGAVMLCSKEREESFSEREGFDVDLRVALIAFATGLTSGFFGIGGGIFIVPALMFATGMSMINAIGSSLLAVGTLGLTTAISYALSGMVDWQLGLEFVFGGIAGAFAGMRIAIYFAADRIFLKRVFAVIIFFVAVYILFHSRMHASHAASAYPSTGGLTDAVVLHAFAENAGVNLS